jgi:hypothetical protein
MAVITKRKNIIDKLREFVPTKLHVEDISCKNISDIYSSIEDIQNSVLYFSIKKVYKNMCCDSCREQLTTTWSKEHNMFYKDNHMEFSFQHELTKQEVLSFLEYEEECPVCFDDASNKIRLLCKTCGKSVCKDCVDDIISRTTQQENIEGSSYSCPICTSTNIYGDTTESYPPNMKRAARHRPRGRRAGRKNNK